MFTIAAMLVAYSESCNFQIQILEEVPDGCGGVWRNVRRVTESSQVSLFRETKLYRTETGSEPGLFIPSKFFFSRKNAYSNICPYVLVFVIIVLVLIPCKTKTHQCVWIQKSILILLNLFGLLKFVLYPFSLQG